MCEECHMSVCPSGCPNVPKPPHTLCDWCSIEIYDGDYCYDIDNITICENCANEQYRRVYNSESEKGKNGNF